MIPFVPMIPGHFQDSASGVFTPVLLVGTDGERKTVTVIYRESGLIETVSEWLCTADPDWVKHYLESIS